MLFSIKCIARIHAFGFQTRYHKRSTSPQRARKLDSIRTYGIDKSFIFSIWHRMRNSLSLVEKETRNRWDLRKPNWETLLNELSILPKSMPNPKGNLLFSFTLLTSEFHILFIYTVWINLFVKTEHGVVPTVWRHLHTIIIIFSIRMLFLHLFHTPSTQLVRTSQTKSTNKQSIYMFWCTQMNLQDLVDNDIFTQVISIESINNLGTHQLRQEGLLARRVDYLLLHRAVVRNPIHQELSKTHTKWSEEDQRAFFSRYPWTQSHTQWSEARKQEASQQTAPRSLL